MMWLLVGCASTPPVAMPLASGLQQNNNTMVRIAAVIIDQKPQLLLCEYVVITRENPPQFTAERMGVTLTDSQFAAIPWRDDRGMRYAPIIIAGTISISNGQRQLVDVSDIDTTMREQTVANLDMHRIVRVIGLPYSDAEHVYLHDRTNPRQRRAFRPVWRSEGVPIQLAVGVPLLVEAVRIDDDLIPLVIAQVSN